MTTHKTPTPQPYENTRHLWYFRNAKRVVRTARYEAYIDMQRSRTDEALDYHAKRRHALDAHENHWVLQDDYDLHPVVDYLVERYCPNDWQQLLLEWPHVAKTDSSRIAYTRDGAAAAADRQTLTSIGKYIARHWALPDHILRDAAALYTPDEIRYAAGVPAMVTAVEMGPRSCMQSGYGTIPFKERHHEVLKAWLADKSNEEPDWERHPYSVYLPEYGWGIVTRVSKGAVMGRCVVWTNPEDPDTRVFVRSYMRNSAGDNYSSGSDTKIEAWLVEQGYSKECGWPDGALFAAVEHPIKGGWMMPYLDGSDASERKVSVDHRNGRDVIVKDCDGDYTCDNTDGTMSPDDDDDDDDEHFYCEDCGERTHYDDSYNVGRHEDRRVCGGCIDDYTEVRGRDSRSRLGYNLYYLPNSDATPVYESYADMRRGNEVYFVDNDHPPSDLVCTDDGYAPVDEVICCTDGEWRFPDDPDVVELAEHCPSSGECYALRNDAWQDGYGSWYSDSEEYIEWNGKKWREADAWTCAGTGLMYPEGAPCVEDDGGETYSADYLERCSRSAEQWHEEYVQPPQHQYELPIEQCEPELALA